VRDRTLETVDHTRLGVLSSRRITDRKYFFPTPPVNRQASHREFAAWGRKILITAISIRIHTDEPRRVGLVADQATVTIRRLPL